MIIIIRRDCLIMIQQKSSGSTEKKTDYNSPYRQQYRVSLYLKYVYCFFFKKTVYVFKV